MERNADGVPMIYNVPDNGQGTPPVKAENNLLKVVYDMRPITSPSPWAGEHYFSTVRDRAEKEWKAMAPYKAADPISQDVAKDIQDLRSAIHNN